MRTFLRLRDTFVKDCSSHVLRMQKALTEMNIQIHRVLSDITGYTGSEGSGFCALRPHSRPNPKLKIGRIFGYRGRLELTLPRHEQLFAHGQVNPFFWLRSARMEAPGLFEQLLFSFGQSFVLQ